LNEDEDGEDDDGDEEDSTDRSLHLKSASEHPDYKWVIMWQSWTMLTDCMRRATCTNPDSFDMYIYNDFHCV